MKSFFSAVKMVFTLIPFVIKNRKALADMYVWGGETRYAPNGDPRVGITLKFEEDDEQPGNGTQYRAVCGAFSKTLEETEHVSFAIVDKHDIISDWFDGVERVFFNFKGKYKNLFLEKLYGTQKHD